MVGTGYVGLVSGACFAEIGNQVLCIDKDKKKIKDLSNGDIPIYEPGLEELVKENSNVGRLQFSHELSSNITDADVVFIAVGTPRGKEDGKADLSYVFKVAEELANLITNNTVVATKSTVPVGTGKRVEKIINDINPNINLSIASVPEFLREGYAVSDFMNPDRIIIGTDSDLARNILRQLHEPLVNFNEKKYIITGIETAELIKYTANAFLAVKISYINEIANLCEKLGANVEEVADGVGADRRINRWGLSAGPGFGGSCFPKDTLALINTAVQHKSPVRIVEAAVAVNDTRKASLFSRIRDELGGELRDKTIAVLGVTFKSNTDDLRDSPSMKLIPNLLEYGAIVRVYDPKGMCEASKMFDIYCANNVYEAATGADVAVIMTEWKEFGPESISLQKLKENLKFPVLIDFRNMFEPEYVADHGITYVSIGRNIAYPE